VAEDVDHVSDVNLADFRHLLALFVGRCGAETNTTIYLSTLHSGKRRRHCKV
jgi:hypothetical protein